jgi:hypothetical protein
MDRISAFMKETQGKLFTLFAWEMQQLGAIL